jgi:hypothetical protein
LDAVPLIGAPSGTRHGYVNRHAEIVLLKDKTRQQQSDVDGRDIRMSAPFADSTWISWRYKSDSLHGIKTVKDYEFFWSGAAEGITQAWRRRSSSWDDTTPHR